MSDRLSRIFNLSKKTGDTVIVHDPSAEHDLVVLPFTQYENLIAREEFPQVEYDEYLLEDMSERELIDKINRDIGVWRSFQELNERDGQASILADQLEDEPLPDPFEEDFSHHTDWHRVGEVVNERHRERFSERQTREEVNTEPVRTYVPVEESILFHHPRHLSPSAVPEVISPVLGGAESGEDMSNFHEETPLSDDEDPVFFEEPTT